MGSPAKMVGAADEILGDTDKITCWRCLCAGTGWQITRATSRQSYGEPFTLLIFNADLRAK